MSEAFGIGFTIGAAFSSSFGSVFNTLEQKLKGAASEVDVLNNKGKKAATAASAIDERSLDLQRQYSELYAKREALSQSMADLRIRKANGGTGASEELKQTIKEYKSLGVQLDNLSTAYRKAHQESQEFGVGSSNYIAEQTRRTQELARANTVLARATRQQAAVDKRKELRGQLMDTIGPALAVGAPIKWAIDFESAMADAAKTIDGMRDSSGKLTPQYYAMETAIKKMGRELPLTHEQLAGLFAAGGQMGMSGVDELEEFATMAAHMSVAFGMSTEAAADSIGGFRSSLGLSLDETRDALDLMNYYANTSSATEASIANIVSRIGGIGKISGVSHQSVTAMAATLASMKIPDEVAGTGLKNFMLAMTKGGAASKGAREALAKMGIDSKKLAVSMQQDAEGTMMKVMRQILHLPAHMQSEVMMQIFGTESLGPIAPMLTQLDELEKNLAVAGDKTKWAGAMQKEFENRSRTTANALVLMKNRIKETGINIGSVLLPPLNSLLNIVGPLISGIADFAQKHQGLTTFVVGAAVGLIAFRIAAIGAAYASTFMGGGLLNVSKVLGIFIPGMATATTVSQVLSVGVRGVGIALRFAFGPIGLLIGAATLAFGYLWEKCEWFREGFLSLWEGLKSAPGAFAEMFIQALKGLGESIGRFFENIPGFSHISGFFKDAWSGLKDFAGMDDDDKDKVGVKPATKQEQEKQRSSAISVKDQRTSGLDGPSAPRQAAGSTPSAPTSRPGATGTSGGSGPSVSMNFHISGITDNGFTQRLMEALRQNSGQFERIIADIVHNQERLAHG